MKLRLRTLMVGIAVALLSCDGDKVTDSDGNNGTQGGVSFVGGYPIPGADGLFVSGDYAYVGGDSGLYIIDVSSPAHPVRLGLSPGSSPGSGGAEAVFASGDHAYVADYRDGVIIIDVSDPGQPDSLSSYTNGDGRCQNVSVSGAYAYVANQDSGLWIIDASDPLNPSLANVLPVAPRDISTVGDSLYVLDTDSGLVRKYSIVDRSNPQPVCSSAVPSGTEHCLSLFASGSCVCVTDDIWDDWDSLGLRTYDGTTCAPRGVLSTPGYASDVFISGNYAYIADYGYGIWIVDIQTITAPQVADSSDVPAYPQNLFVQGDYIYVTGWHAGTAGLFILNYVP